MVVLLVLGLALVVVDGAPAAACSCFWDQTTVLETAGAAFTGEFDSLGPVYEPSGPYGIGSSALRFSVDEVFAGSVGPLAEVLTPNGSCQLNPLEGERWFIVASREPPRDDLFVGSCGPSEMIGAGNAPRWIGEGHPPDDDLAAPPRRTPRDLPGGDPDELRSLVLGALAAAVGSLLALGHRRRAQQAPG